MKGPPSKLRRKLRCDGSSKTSCPNSVTTSHAQVDNGSDSCTVPLSLDVHSLCGGCMCVQILHQGALLHHGDHLLCHPLLVEGTPPPACPPSPLEHEEILLVAIESYSHSVNRSRMGQTLLGLMVERLALRIECVSLSAFNFPSYLPYRHTPIASQRTRLAQSNHITVAHASPHGLFPRPAAIWLQTHHHCCTSRDGGVLRICQLFCRARCRQSFCGMKGTLARWVHT